MKLRKMMVAVPPTSGKLGLAVSQIRVDFNEDGLN